MKYQFIKTATIIVSVFLFTSCSSKEAENGKQRLSQFPELSARNEISPVRVGYEILQIRSFNKFVVWINTEMSPEEFESLKLPIGWFKNQPREADPDSASFARSPDASRDGEFTDKERFGHMWRHNATVIDRNVELPNDEGLLKGIHVAKYHEVTFNAGSTINVLISPTGQTFIRISRDVGRNSDTPTIPSSWKLSTIVVPESITFRLPNPTLNIRMDNEDSFQGPVTF
jgi:hypothetical protein